MNKVPLTAIIISCLLLVVVGLSSESAQSQAQTPEAVIHAGSQQNVGYTISIDCSQSTGRNPMGVEGDIFGIKTYTWDFGDGSEEQSGDYFNTITHVYDAPGAYTIHLEITDYFGESAEATTTITVGTLPVAMVSGNNDAAIRSAIDSLHGQPGIVSLPPGEYAISNPFTLHSGMILEGAGPDQTRLINASGGYILTVSGDNVRITGLEFEGPIDHHAIYNGGYKNLYVDHCDMHGFKYANAITNFASATFEHNDIHDNPVSGYGYGIMVTSGAYVMVRNNEFSNNRHSIASGGKGAEPGWNTGYDFIHNHIEKDDNTARDVAIDGHAGIHGRIRISDNLLENISYGIGLRDGWGEIRRNTFRNISSYILKLDEPTYSGTWIPGGGISNFYIDNNTIINCGTHWRILYAIENVYLNCRKIDHLIPYQGNTSWNDCGPVVTCDGDLNEDGQVNNQDVQLLVDAILEGNPNGLCADLNDDRFVDAIDLQDLINQILNQ
jgi:parallel beta-helix repeat protein